MLVRVRITHQPEPRKVCEAACFGKESVFGYLDSWQFLWMFESEAGLAALLSPLKKIFV
jgi:hypothetical protein